LLDEIGEENLFGNIDEALASVAKKTQKTERTEKQS
jgi:hypothetical protein